MSEKIDLLSTLVKAGETAAEQQQTQVDIMALMDAQETNYAQQALVVDELSSAKKVISAQQEAFAAETDAKKLAAEVAYSSNFSDQASKTNYWAKEVHENAAKAYASLDAINEKKKSNLLEDPIGYIMNQFTLPSDIAAHNYYVNKHNVADTALNTLIKGTSDAAIMAKNMEKSTSTEQALAKLTEIETQAKWDKLKISKEAAGTRMSGLQTLNQMDIQQTAAAYQALSAVNADQHLKLAQRSADDQHQMRMMQQKEFNEKTTAKLEANQSMEAEMQSYNAGARLANRPEIHDVKTFQRVAQNAIQRKDQDFLNVVSAGQLIELNGGKVDGVMIAKNAGDTASMYSKSGPMLKGNSVGSFMADTYNNLKARPGVNAKDIEAFNAVANTEIVATAKAKMNKIKDSEPNIYAALPVDIIAKSKTGQQLLTTPFMQSTIVPMYNADKDVKIPDTLMLEKASKFVLSNRSELDSTAKAIATYYQSAIHTNNVVKRYVENGLPPQQSYMWDSGYGTRNLASEVEIKRLLMIRIAKDISGAQQFLGY